MYSPGGSSLKLHLEILEFQVRIVLKILLFDDRNLKLVICHDRILHLDDGHHTRKRKYMGGEEKEEEEEEGKRMNEKGAQWRS